MNSLDRIIASKQSYPEQVRRTQEAWAQTPENVKKTINALEEMQAKKKQEIEKFDDGLPLNKINKLIDEKNVSKEALKKPETSLQAHLSTRIGLVAYIISKIFIINYLINCIGSLKEANRVQTELEREIQTINGKIASADEKIQEIIRNAGMLIGEVEVSKLPVEKEYNRFTKKLEKRKRLEKGETAQAEATAKVHQMLEGKKTSQLKDRWGEWNLNWVKTYMIKAKELMTKEGTSICTGAYSSLHIRGIYKPTLFVCFKQGDKVQMLYQDSCDRSKWKSVSEGGDIVSLDTVTVRRQYSTIQYNWDPINEPTKTTEIEKMIKTL